MSQELAGEATHIWMKVSPTWAVDSSYYIFCLVLMNLSSTQNTLNFLLGPSFPTSVH